MYRKGKMIEKAIRFFVYFTIISIMSVLLYMEMNKFFGGVFSQIVSALAE